MPIVVAIMTHYLLIMMAIILLLPQFLLSKAPLVIKGPVQQLVKSVVKQAEFTEQNESKSEFTFV